MFRVGQVAEVDVLVKFSGPLLGLIPCRRCSDSRSHHKVQGPPEHTLPHSEHSLQGTTLGYFHRDTLFILDHGIES